MNYGEFKRHLGKAGLSINEFSSLIEVGASSVSNYAKKNAVPTQYAVIAVLLGDIADRNVDFRELLKRFGLDMRSFPASPNISHINDFRKRPGVES